MTPWIVRIVRPDSTAAAGVPVSLLDDAGNPAGYWVSDVRGEVAIPHLDAPRIRLRVGLRSEDPREIDRAALEAGTVDIPAPSTLGTTVAARTERSPAPANPTPRLTPAAVEPSVPSQTVRFTRLVVFTPQPDHALLERPDGSIVSPPALPAPHDAEAGALELRYGALIEVEQYWQSLGYVTGDLLYTVSLAPGDEARVAILDRRWANPDEAAGGAPISGIPRPRPLEQLARQAASAPLAAALSESDGSLPLEPLVLAPGDTHLEVIATETSRQLLDQSAQLAALIRRRPLEVVETGPNTNGLPLGTPVRTVRNPDGHPVAFHYFEPLERWRVGARAARLRPVVLVPFQFPNLASRPQIQRFGRILRRTLLDRDLVPDLEWMAGLSTPNGTEAPQTALPVSELRLIVQIDPNAPPLDLRQVWCYLHVDQTRYTVHFFPVDPRVPVEPGFAAPRPTRWIGAIRLADFHQHPLRFPGHLALENGTRSTLAFTQLVLEGRAGDTWKRLLAVKDFALAGQTEARLASLAALAERNGVDPREGRIVEHLANHLPFYAAAIIAAGDPALRQAAIGKVRDATGRSLADLIDHRIVGFLGNYVACPLRSTASLPPNLQAAFAEATWASNRPVEEIVTTLPLPGVWLSQQSLAAPSTAEATHAEATGPTDRRRWRGGAGA